MDIAKAKLSWPMGDVKLIIETSAPHREQAECPVRNVFGYFCKRTERPFRFFRLTVESHKQNTRLMSVTVIL